MKKTPLIPCLLIMLFLAGCGETAPVVTDSQDMQDTDEKNKYYESEDIYDVKVSLGQYKGVSPDVSLRKVTDDAIQEIIDSTVESYGGCFEEKEDEEVKEGDRVTIYTTELDPETKEPVAPGSLETEYYVIGKEGNPEGYDNALLGKKKGEGAEVTNGTGTFILTVIEVDVPAPLSDGFVKGMEIEGVETVEALKEDIKKYLEDRYKEEYNNELREHASEIVMESSEIKEELPEDLIAEYKKVLEERIANIVKNQQEQQGNQDITEMDVLEGYMKNDQFVGTVSDYIDFLAKRNAREYLIYSAIADAEGIKVEYDELYSRIAADWQAEGESYATLKDYVAKKDKEVYYKALICTKAMEFIAENSESGLMAVETEEKKDESEADGQ